MKILLLTRYNRTGPSSRIRCYQYLPYLKEAGLEIKVCPLLGEKYLQTFFAGKKKHFLSICRAYWKRLGCLLHSKQYDLIWFEEELFPWLPAWAESFFNFFKIAYAVDYDDAVFHRYDQNKRKWVRFLLGRKIAKVMAGAAIVIAGNEYLAEYARTAGAARVEYLPSVIDLKRYPSQTYSPGLSFTIGWMGTPYTAKYVIRLAPVLRQFLQQYSARLVLVGAGEITIPGLNVEVKPWSEESEVSDIGQFDVGIMPLPDDPFERGKCGYKLIQYMACSRPVIASPVGVNKKLVDDGVDGFLAAGANEWLKAFETLYHDPELRVKMGAAGRRKVEQHFCIQVAAPLLAAWFKEFDRANLKLL